ncbi:MAG TPA: hypothetical protein VK588_12150 [Chitinophagaceae bacterium]|nr:hypothetical protein [Chitinophagaceae bacterium]
MKKYRLLLFLFLLSAPCRAQRFHWGQSIPDDHKATCVVSLAYGMYSSDYMFDGNQPGFIGPGITTHINSRYSGTLNAGVHYFVGRRISLGFLMLYENGGGEWQENYYDGSRYGAFRRIGTYKRQAVTAAVEMKFIYTHRANHMFYCSAGIGGTYQNEVDRYDEEYSLSSYKNGINTLGTSLELDNNKEHLNMYISPIGFSAGNTIGFFAELGIGYKGIINAGINVKL